MNLTRPKISRKFCKIIFEYILWKLDKNFESHFVMLLGPLSMKWYSGTSWSVYSLLITRLQFASLHSKQTKYFIAVDIKRRL